MSKVVTANVLSTGHVVFLAIGGSLATGGIWVGSIEEAEVFADAEAADEGLAIAKRDAEHAVVVEPFVTDTGESYTGKSGGAPAMTLRDTIRARGPTIDFLPASAAARG